LDLYSEMTTAFESYITDVKNKDFPSEKEQY
jgi:3-methyl-2-oxobutanoate hydroxymethyltransferase